MPVIVAFIMANPIKEIESRRGVRLYVKDVRPESYKGNWKLHYILRDLNMSDVDESYKGNWKFSLKINF